MAEDRHEEPTRALPAIGPRLARFRVTSEPLERRLQATLAIVGSVLMPVGLAAIVLAWYGAAHTGYVFEQLAYLISGGLIGLGMIGAGGFLFFGSWLARLAHQQRAQTELIAAQLARIVAALESRDGSRGETPEPRRRRTG